jgi:tetratricopeptide (TPR) repeat protein
MDRDRDEIVDALKDAATWEPAAEPPPASRLRMDELIAFRERLAREDAAGAELCDQLLTGPSAWWRTRLRQDPNGRTAGVVRQLIERVQSFMERTPADALVVTTLASEIAGALAVGDYPSDFVITLRAQALRDHAFVLSEMGRFREASAAAGHAERLFLQTPVPDYELARLALVRSNIARSLEHYDDAIRFAEQAAAVFLRFGDRKAWVDACIYQAATLFRLRSYARAAEVWRSIEHDTALAGDAVRVGTIHNLGLCYREMGKYDEAARYLSAAAAEFDLLGHETHRAKSRWALAVTLATAQRYEEAIPLLRATWRELESLGMEGDAALVALELAEALLITRRTAEVPAICRALIDRFARAGMTERALTAMAFLRETVASGHVTPTHVRHVHDFLRDLPADGERLFAAPPPGSLED